MKQPQGPRDRWGSKLGFILATSGAAVGLGNIQRFPYITAQYGGAAFVLLYLACVVGIGLPLILVEFALGRHTRKNPASGIASLRPKSVLWPVAGGLGILTSFFILTYYMVVAGWTLAYGCQMLTGTLMPLASFAAKPHLVIPAAAIFQLVTILIVSRGLKKGIERTSKILMPLLVLLLLALAVRSLSLEGSGPGLTYYLAPDFSKLNAEAFLQALGQAFFSLCIGEAVLVTYGSYAGKEDNLIASAAYIALFDTLVALLAGLVIFPALSAFGAPPDQGVGLIFNVMPSIFTHMPFGAILGCAFFLILAFAALTTCVALLEIPVAYLMETKGWSRKTCVWTVGTTSFLLSIPSALSKGASPFLSNLTLGNLPLKGFYDIMDFLWGNLAMVVGGFFLTIFTAWVWGSTKAIQELSLGCPSFVRWGPLWAFHIKFVAPALILAVLAAMFF